MAAGDRPTISFLIPTVDGSRPLRRSVGSIVSQLLPGDEVLVVGDVHDGPRLEAEQTCAEFSDNGYNVQYLEYDAGHHCWGHCGLNYGFDNASGDLLCINDDDDIWVPDAAFSIRSSAVQHPGKPLLFRFKAWYGTILWEQKDLMVRDHIGGHCLIQPNIDGKIGRMACVYNGDFDMIHRCLMAHGGYDSAVWIDKIIAIARPPYD